MKEIIERLRRLVVPIEMGDDFDSYDATEVLKEAINALESNYQEIQFLRGARARHSIEMSLINDLIEDPGFIPSGTDHDYWHETHDKLRDALASMPAWVKCEERLPPDERDVVICNMNCTNTYSHPYEPSESLRLAFGGGKTGWFDSETGAKIPTDELTHWFDVGLPAPPIQQEG